MSKVDSSTIAALKALFTTGSTLLETNFADLIDAIADAAEDHQHVSTGGAGSGTGDAGPVINLQSGTAAEKPGTPAVGDIYVETDTSKVYACYTTGNWTEVGVSEPGAPTDATYVTINAEAGLSAETQHVNLTGADLHDPKPHDHVVWKTLVFCIPGDLSTGTNVAPSVPADEALTIDKVYVYARTAPTGASIIVDVNKNGTTIFTTQGNRPEIAIGGNTDESGTPDVTALAKNDRVDVDIDQVGSTVAGADLTIMVRCKQDTTS